MYSISQAQDFAARWLPAWTGNQPEALLNFYAEDTFYSDPAVPQGVQGKSALRTYFTRLLAANPDWVWTQREAIPMQGGFVNHWQAVIPVGDQTLTLLGVCLVELNGAGEITRNQVYFDRSPWLKALALSASSG
jgi:steroid delta-isomerase-like uncharacterized protein